VPPGSWAGKCTLTGDLSFLLELAWTTSEATVASGWERGGQETKYIFFSLSLLPLSTTFLWGYETQEVADKYF
jgi:hypothetical protein